MVRIWLLLLTLSVSCTSGLCGSEDSNGPELPPDLDWVVPTAGGDPWAIPPSLPPLTDSMIDTVREQIDAILDDSSLAGTTQSVTVVDLENHQVLYQRNSTLRLAPASNTKMFTTAAALDLLGDDHRFTTKLVSAGAVDANGVLNAELVLYGDHDFTWSTHVLENARWPLEQLADQLWNAGVRSIRGGVRVHGDVLFDGYRFGQYSPTAQREQVRVELASALEKRGITVSESTAATGAVENGAVLAQWQSPTVAVSTVPINRLSHNEFADVLARHLAAQLGGVSDYSTWHDESRSWLAARGIASDVDLFDGSGLSHDNRVSSKAVADLTAFMARSANGERWLRSLSIAGVSGTLASRLGGEDTLGRVFAKTGTLTGVIATSGILYNRHDQHRYVFSILMNDTADATLARAAQDRVIGVIADDLRGQAVPASPILQRVSRRASGLVELSWTSVPGAQGYVVWLSEDGKTWSRENARFVTGSSFLADGVSRGAVYVKVAAHAGGLESLPSDVYATDTGAGTRILIVDANDRWQDDPVWENTLAAGHDFVVDHARALGDAAYDSVANEMVTSGELELSEYDLVVWSSGEEGADQLAFSPEEQVSVSNFVDAGGRLLVSGSEIGWQLVENGSSADADFYRNVLGAEYLGDDAGAYYVRDSSAEVIGFYNPGEQEVSYPDRLKPAAGADVLLTYENGSTEAAAIGSPKRVVYMAFPFEAVDGDQTQRDLMARLLSFLL